MRLFTAEFVQRWYGRMLNIHPSLLPSFPGLDPHGQALRAGVKISGATVHFVIPETDAGPIVMQGAVAVADDDTAETLSQRILGIEHRIYPEALRLLASGQASPRRRHLQDRRQHRSRRHPDFAADDPRYRPSRLRSRMSGAWPRVARAVAAEQQWRVFGGAAGGEPIDPSARTGGKSLRLIGICAFCGPAPFALGNGLHALLIAAFASTENRRPARSRGWSRLRSFSWQSCPRRRRNRRRRHPLRHLTAPVRRRR